MTAPTENSSRGREGMAFLFAWLIVVRARKKGLSGGGGDDNGVDAGYLYI
jgi:hypothetical protein